MNTHQFKSKIASLGAHYQSLWKDGWLPDEDELEAELIEGDAYELLFHFSVKNNLLDAPDDPEFDFPWFSNKGFELSESPETAHPKFIELLRFLETHFHVD